MTTSSNASPGQTLYTMYYPTGLTAPPPTKATIARAKKGEIRGWKEWDYLDYEDFENAIEQDAEIPYALCQWLMRQSYGNPGDPFTEAEWDDWYQYAFEHCERFAKEQPRW
jgi:hypothetical protein